LKGRRRRWGKNPHARYIFIMVELKEKKEVADISIIEKDKPQGQRKEKQF